MIAFSSVPHCRTKERNYQPDSPRRKQPTAIYYDDCELFVEMSHKGAV